MRRENGKVTVFFLIISIVSMIISRAGQHIASGLLLCAGAVLLFIHYFKVSRSLVDFRALLSLFWIGGEGIAAFQLSYLQKDWEIVTWCCFGAFYLAFLWGYEYLSEKLDVCALKNTKKGRRKTSAFLKSRNEVQQKKESREQTQRRVLNCIIITALISSFAFLIEMLVLGYVPIFSEAVHAYSEFHISGLHYFTVSCMMVHALTLIYIMRGTGKWYKRELSVLAICNILALIVAVACISKFQFLLTVALPAIIYLKMKRNLNYRRLCMIGAAGVVCVAVVFGFMIIQRNYEPGYLNDIFEMKNSRLPMAIQYPYMYIANNYENFNCLVAQLPGHTAGMKQLFPVFALTGMKFVFPHMVNYPLYVTKPELNTLTIIYDAYYDGGIPGVILFGIILGIVCWYLTKRTRIVRNPIIYLFYGQIAMYVILSFFSAWFTVPTTWFWLVITGIMYYYVEHGAKIPKRRSDF